MHVVLNIREKLERLRLRLAGQRGALVLAALGLVCGVLAVTVAFCATVNSFERGPPAAGAAQPVSSRYRVWA